LFKLLSDTFIVKEITGSNSSEALLENEIYISDDMPNIEKIISTEGKVKINNTSVQNNKVVVNGELNYTIIYRSNDDEIAICSMPGKASFSEEIQIPNAKENMDADINVFIDYIEADMESERKILLKAVANIDVELINKRSVDFISSLESDGSFQAKTKNITYTDVVSNSSEDFNVSDEVELNQNSNQIANILKADGDAYITNVDVMNERMLLEGICKVGFFYTEDNNLSTAGYITEEFPFTHYIEVKKHNRRYAKRNYN
jgi:ribosomal 50S subunit-recycling heat shock protein